MKFNIFVILILSLCASLFAGTADDPNLIGWWNFNDGGAKDWSQYGHHGVLRNGARVVYDTERGMVLHNPKAGYLDPNEGHSGHVYCGGERASIADPCTWADIPRSYTVLMWIKSQMWWTPPWPGSPNQFEKEWQAIFTKGTRGYGQLIITTVGTQGRIYFRARGLQPSTNDHINGNTFIDDGNWHHIAAVCEYDAVTGQTALHLYIDGYEEYNSPVIATGSLILCSDPVYIAGSYGGSTKDGEIYMDDVRLYNRALTESEILTAMDEPIPSDFTGDSKIDMDDFRVLAKDWMETDYTIASDTGGMVAHWDFAGAAGETTVPDLVGDNDAVIVGGGQLDGNGAAVLTGGPDGPYIDLGANLGNVISDLEYCTIFIDCVWDGNSTSWQRLFTVAQPGTTEFSTITYVSVNERWLRYYQRHNAHDEETNASNPTYVPEMKGQHQIAISITKDYGLYGCTIIYIDGVKAAFHTNLAPCSLDLLGQTSRNYIGRGPFERDPLDANTINIDNRFAGKINDVRIYGRRLSERDVKDIYEGVSRQLYFKLEAPGNLSDAESTNSKVVDFKDLAALVNKWLQQVPLLEDNLN